MTAQILSARARLAELEEAASSVNMAPKLGKQLLMLTLFFADSSQK